MPCARARGPARVKASKVRENSKINFPRRGSTVFEYCWTVGEVPVVTTDLQCVLANNIMIFVQRDCVSKTLINICGALVHIRLLDPLDDVSSFFYRIKTHCPASDRCCGGCDRLRGGC